ncbi:hypothetical protein ACIRRX_26050 [Streptomyces bacillaris]|uniref:hypothetical protein n=1 Tax=unclassified Streptomyces TaxID=2593676 RepID=UPI00131A0BC6|nr:MULTISPECIES: hypothetical protein [unclassified Streptomyces]MYT39087.1 hypothetical protein [Streptomyces sp. SID8356]
MSATHNNPPVTGAGSGSGGGNGDDGSKIRKFEAVVILLVGVIAGVLAGIGSRTMDHASWFEAITSGVVVGVGLPGFIIMIIRYIRNQS